MLSQNCSGRHFNKLGRRFAWNVKPYFLGKIAKKKKKKKKKNQNIICRGCILYFESENKIRSQRIKTDACAVRSYDWIFELEHKVNCKYQEHITLVCFVCAFEVRFWSTTVFVKRWIRVNKWTLNWYNQIHIMFSASKGKTENKSSQRDTPDKGN